MLGVISLFGEWVLESNEGWMQKGRKDGSMER